MAERSLAVLLLLLCSFALAINLHPDGFPKQPAPQALLLANALEDIASTAGVFCPGLVGRNVGGRTLLAGEGIPHHGTIVGDAGVGGDG